MYIVLELILIWSQDYSPSGFGPPLLHMWMLSLWNMLHSLCCDPDDCPCVFPHVSIVVSSQVTTAKLRSFRVKWLCVLVNFSVHRNLCPSGFRKSDDCEANHQQELCLACQSWKCAFSEGCCFWFSFSISLCCSVSCCHLTWFNWMLCYVVLSLALWCHSMVLWDCCVFCDVRGQSLSSTRLHCAFMYGEVVP